MIQVFSFVCVLTWSLLGVKKILGHAQIGLLQGYNSKVRRVSPPLSHVEFPPRGCSESILMKLSDIIIIYIVKILSKGILLSRSRDSQKSAKSQNLGYSCT